MLRSGHFPEPASTKAPEGKHENKKLPGSAIPSPQRNVNEIRDVRNTNHAPATILYKNNIYFSELRRKLPPPLATNLQDRFAWGGPQTAPSSLLQPRHAGAADQERQTLAATVSSRP